MTWPVEDGTFALGDLPVERGGTIKDAHLVWQSHGTLSPERDNVIVYPTSYTAQHDDLSWLIGPDQILDPERYFIVVVDMFSNGLSSSAADTPDFPAVVTPGDNVSAQRRLLLEHFQVTRIAAVYGFSTGAIQAYHWLRSSAATSRGHSSSAAAPGRRCTIRFSSPVCSALWRQRRSMRATASSPPSLSWRCVRSPTSMQAGA